MGKGDFDARFAGGALALGGVMVAAGYWMRPVAVGQNFDVTSLLAVEKATWPWIHSFQVLVFGLFVRLAGLGALGALHLRSRAPAVVLAGAAVCGAALLVTAAAEGYYMHMGAWGGYEMRQAADAAREAFLANIRPVSEWVICLARMGHMFFCFGLVVLGLGLVRGGLVRRWPGATAMLIGVAGMTILMLYPDSPRAYLPVAGAITLWHVALGASVFRGVQTASGG